MAALVCVPIAAEAQDAPPAPKKKVRVILLPQEDQPLDPPPGRKPPTASRPAPQAPPGLPQRPQQSPGAPPVPTPVAGPGGLAESVLQDKMGMEAFRNLYDALQGCGRGAPCAHLWFDQAGRSNDDADSRPQGTRFFSGEFRQPTVVDARRTVDTYGGIPGGGVVLEGTASGLGTIEEIGYDARYNALVLDGRAVYFIRMPPPIFAELCRAIAEKDELGVSLGQRRLVYGALQKNSDVAFDLTLADRFLGDIVFARNDWTAGYRFAGGFSPRPHVGPLQDMAVFFRFNDFRFQVQRRELVLVGARLDVTLVPLSRAGASDGNLLPDFEAIEAGVLSPQFQANAKHIAENIAYYRREQIVHRTYAYGEAAALLRSLRAEGADLRELAAQIVRQ